MIVRFRDDDILLDSRGGWDKPFLRFKEIHEQCLESAQIIHVPAMLYKESQKFPEIFEYVKQETKLNRMHPEVHGYEHINYGTRVRGVQKDTYPHEWTIEEKEKAKDWVREEIKFTKDWITEEFGRVPKFWYTPWGADQSHLYEVAKDLNLVLVDCRNNFTPIETVTKRLREGSITVDKLDGREIFFHWWQRGCRVHRLAKSIKYGSWDEAQRRYPELFR